ncbi:hypothetical protein [Nocardiopsis coralliicola]
MDETTEQRAAARAGDAEGTAEAGTGNRFWWAVPALGSVLYLPGLLFIGVVLFGAGMAAGNCGDVNPCPESKAQARLGEYFALAYLASGLGLIGVWLFPSRRGLDAYRFGLVFLWCILWLFAVALPMGADWRS